MDNYKIKVKDEAESKEAQELFFALGASRPDGTKNTYHSPTVFGLLVVDGLLNYVFAESVFYDSKAKELTLPQLRDLVVLKCNDVKDATHRDKQQNSIYLTSDKVIYYWQGEWCKSAINKSNDYENYIANSLTPIAKPQAPALISGADALRALADGKEVEGFSEENEEWIPIVYFSVQEVVNGLYKFRLKPQTIKLELELPKPFKPRDGDDCFIVDSEQEDGFYRFTYSEDSGFHQNFIQFGAYKTEDDVKKAVEQLRKIRGTNS